MGIQKRWTNLTCRLFIVGALGAMMATLNVTEAAFTDATDMLFRFVPDSIGTRPEVADSSGNGYDAFSANNVTCGLASNGRHLTGFTTTTSYLVSTNVMPSGWNSNWTAVTWIRNPDFTGTSPLVLMRGAGTATNFDGGSGNVPWQVWLTLDGRVGIGIHNWSNNQTNNLAESARGPVLEWKADTWYQIAVVCKYTARVSPEARIRNVKVYVTEAGADSVGDCVAELEQDTVAGFAAGAANFLLGAGRTGWYQQASPGGYFGGDISETTFFTRCLTTGELAEDVTSFSPSYFDTEDFASLYWKLDESVTTPTATDATTNGLDGVTTGSVFGGIKSPQGGCYSGFESTSDQLYATLPTTGWWQNTYQSEVLLWVRRPHPTSSSTALLVSNMRQYNSPASAQPWRVAVEENGAVSVSMQTWRGSTEKNTGEAYEWGNNWHLVSIRFDRPTLPVENVTDNGDGTKTTNMTTFACNRIRVYAAKASTDGTGTFQLLATCQHQRYNDILDGGTHLVFGSAGSGYYGEFQPKSILGSGARLGEVAVKYDGYFEWEYLLSRLDRYALPIGATLVIR